MIEEKKKMNVKRNCGRKWEVESVAGNYMEEERKEGENGGR